MRQVALQLEVISAWQIKGNILHSNYSDDSGHQPNIILTGYQANAVLRWLGRFGKLKQAKVCVPGCTRDVRNVLSLYSLIYFV